MRSSPGTPSPDGPPVIGADDAAAELALFPPSERFRLERKLGAGGMGVVFEAWDHERGMPVAIKVLREPTGRMVLRFKQEFRALAGVLHDNLIGFHELFADLDRIYFSMDLVRGLTLRRWVTPTAPARPSTTVPTVSALTLGSPRPGAPSPVPPSPADLARLRIALRGLARGVAAMHEAGWLHRDLKPSNVIVTEEGRAVVLDLGLVSEVSRAQASSGERALEGTIDYMSPEQAARMPLGPPSDWYQVGVILYECLTGRLPFLGDDLDVLMDRQRFEPPPPSQLVEGVPEDLDVLCCELLRRDPAARPDGANLLERLGASEVARPRTGSRSRSRSEREVFVGREAQLAALGAALETTRGGCGVVCEIHGHSGSGKSALVARYTAELAERPDLLVLSSRCYEHESVPFKAVDGMMDGVSQFLGALPREQQDRYLPRDIQLLARMFPVLRQVEAVASWPARRHELADPQEERRRAFRAAKELFGRLSSLHTVVIALDDLQWGDVDSAELLTALLGQPDPPALLLLCAYRTEDRERSLFLRQLGQTLSGLAVDRREVVIGPLPHDESSRLALSLLGGAPVDRARISQMVREAGGNPFFLLELVRACQDRPEATPELSSLDEVLSARLRRLPLEAGRLLAAIALSGRPVAVQLVERATDVRNPSILALLKAGSLVRTRRAQVDEVECYHDRVREAALELLTDDEQRTLHGRLGSVLAARSDEDPEVIATHFFGAGQRKPASVYALKAAARADAALAFDRAVAFYRMALALEQGSAEELRALRARLGVALQNAGRAHEAASAYLEAAEGGTAADALELRRKAAEQLLRGGHIAEGMAVVKTVLQAVGLRMPDTPQGALFSALVQRARLRLRGLAFTERDASQITKEQGSRIDTCWSMAVGLGMVDNVRGIDFATRNLLLSLAAGHPLRIARALAIETCYVSTEGRPSMRAIETRLARTQQIAERAGDWESKAWHEIATGVSSFLCGAWIRTRRHCEEAERLFSQRCLGAVWEVDNARFFILWAAALQGDLKTLYRRTPRLVEDAARQGNVFASTNLRTGLPNLAWVLSGQLAEARSQAREAMRAWPSDSFKMQHFYDLLAQGNIDLYAGDPAPSQARLLERWPALSGSLLLRIQLIRILSWHLRGRVALASATRVQTSGRRSLLRAAERDAGRLVRERLPWSVGLGQLLHAGVANLRGDLDRARTCLDQAAASLAEADMGLFLSATWRRQGELVGGDEGDALVARSRDWMLERRVHQPDHATAMLVPGFGALTE